MAQSSTSSIASVSATSRLLHEVYHGPAWHGPAVKEVLRGVGADVAAKRLEPGRNSIWELVLHLAHGRHLLAERTTNTTHEFPRRIREPWWPIIDYEMTDAAWQRDLRLLDDCQQRLMHAVVHATPEQLARTPEGSTHSLSDQLLGMAVHDGYHAGQIRQLALHFGA